MHVVTDKNSSGAPVHNKKFTEMFTNPGYLLAACGRWKMA